MMQPEVLSIFAAAHMISQIKREPVDEVEAPIDLSVSTAAKATPELQPAPLNLNVKETCALPPVSPAITTTSESSDYMNISSEESDNPSSKAKVVRPFKAYPKEALATFSGSEENETEYNAFREKFMEKYKSLQSKGTNAKMRRTNPNSNHPRANDPDYWEKRRKNNEAAKRSRDARRAKEDEIAMKCAFLERENGKLRNELKTLKDKLQMACALQGIAYQV